MGGCSSGSSGPEKGSCFTEGSRSEIEELVKSGSLEEANRLIREGYILMAVYWNSNRSSEEYILGRIKKKEASAKKIGFSIV